VPAVSFLQRRQMNRTPMTQPLRIRLAKDADRESIYDISRKTGDAGSDARSSISSPTLLGDIFAIPYLLFCPKYSFVVEDAERVCGYVVAAPDTVSFDQRLKSEWWPTMRAQYALSSTPGAELANHFIENFIYRSQLPDATVLRDYPAHVHINVLVDRASGQGSRLLNTVFEALRDDGVSGVHCGVDGRNQRAIAFYRKMGATALIEETWGAVFGFKL
jgi:GNAT superfamily N-acetyltransferase